MKLKIQGKLKQAYKMLFYHNIKKRMAYSDSHTVTVTPPTHTVTHTVTPFVVPATIKSETAEKSQKSQNKREKKLRNRRTKNCRK